MLKSLPTQKTALNVLKKLFSHFDLKQLQKKTQVAVMVGLPGSGKSTISELLVSAYGFWRFSTDQIRVEELFPGQNHRQANDQQHEMVMNARVFVYQELTRRVLEAVKRGQRVVVDGTNLDENRQTLMTALLAAMPAEQIALVVVETPQEILHKRFQREGKESEEKWLSVFKYWQDYMKKGKASYPSDTEYPGVTVSRVQRYDLETFDWITQIGVIVWDIDQTMYQDIPDLTGKIHGHVIKKLAQGLKLSPTEAEIHFQSVYNDVGSTTQTLDRLGLDGRAVMEQAFDDVGLFKALKPDKRLASLFKQLSQFHHVILSNSSKESAEKKLKALGLSSGLFSAIYATYDMPYTKPDKRVFEFVVKQTNFAPHQHLFVGDRLKADILPAKATGMRTALVWSHSEVADISFDTVHQVGRLFGVEV